MYNILISTGAGAAVMLLMYNVLEYAWWSSLICAVITMLSVLALLIRFVMKKVMAAMDAAGKDLQAQRIEKAIRDLKAIEQQYSKWQMFVSGQINSQIGMIYYMKRDFGNAFTYLQDAFFKNWGAMAMLAICYMKRQKKDKMIATFNKAVKWNSKEPLLWGVFAYCLNECGDKKHAREIIEAGLKKCPGNENLKENLENLKQGKKMKMRDYGDTWFQFHLESLGALQKHHMASMGGRMKQRMTAAGRR